MSFETTDRWKKAYPGARVGFLILRGVVNSKSDDLETAKRSLEQKIRSELAACSRESLHEIPALKSYRAYYKGFKKTYHVLLQLESVALRGKSIPAAVPLVGAMFMAELKNLLLTSGHDADRLQPPIVVDSSQGTERYTLINGKEQVLKTKDMYIRDQMGVLSSIIYGPDRRSRIEAGTTSVLYTVYGPMGIGAEDVQNHLEDIIKTVALFAPDMRVEEQEILSS